MKQSRAREVQYNFRTMYEVNYISPSGIKTRLGYTARKSCKGIYSFLNRPIVTPKLLAVCPEAETLKFKKCAGGLDLSNGARIQFGETLINSSEADQ